jgi:protoheme ferro-lyase
LGLTDSQPYAFVEDKYETIEEVQEALRNAVRDSSLYTTLPLLAFGLMN